MKAALVALRFPAPAPPPVVADVGVASPVLLFGTKSLAEAVRPAGVVLALALELAGTKALLIGVRGVLGRDEIGVVLEEAVEAVSEDLRGCCVCRCMGIERKRKNASERAEEAEINKASQRREKMET